MKTDMGFGARLKRARAFVKQDLTPAGEPLHPHKSRLPSYMRYSLRSHTKGFNKRDVEWQNIYERSLTDG